MTAHRPLLLLTLILAVACQDPASNVAPYVDTLVAAAAPTPAQPKDAAPRPTIDLMAAQGNPWSSQAVGSWVEYRLPGGVREQHRLIKRTPARIEIAIFVAQPGTTPSWDATTGYTVAVYRPSDWHWRRRLARQAKTRTGTVEIAGQRLQVHVVESGSLSAILSSAVPGGLVSVRAAGEDQDRRRVVAYGVK